MSEKKEEFKILCECGHPLFTDYYHDAIKLGKLKAIGQQCPECNQYYEIRFLNYEDIKKESKEGFEQEK